VSSVGRRDTQEVLDLKQRFADNLVLLRSRTDLSQVKVSERSSLHLTEISLLERGLRLPRLDTLIKLSGAIEVESCELLAGMSWRLGSNAGRRGAYMRQSASSPEAPEPSESS
jgi:transcriptional regulator with XRE-family HTH domain